MHLTCGVIFDVITREKFPVLCARLSSSSMGWMDLEPVDLHSVQLQNRIPPCSASMKHARETTANLLHKVNVPIAPSGYYLGLNSGL